MTAKRHVSAGGGPRRAVVAIAAAVVAAVVGLVALVGAVQGKDGRAQKITPQLLDALALQYRDAGLPLPPADAPLMLLQAGASNSGGIVWTVGFRLGPAETDETPGRFLVGTETGDARQLDGRLPASRPLDPDKELPTTFSLHGGWTYAPDPFPVNHWLALAVQCHLRGYTRLAEQLFERGLTRDAASVPRLTPLGDGGPRDSLAATAWNHWMNALLIGDTDRREILAHLEKLSAGFPALDGAFQRDYVASLRQTVVPSTATPDSVEALVDGLIDHNDVENPAEAGLKESGFGAVPALIAHLDDRRLTRSVMRYDGEGFNYPRRVNEVVSDLIFEIAGNATDFYPGPAGRTPEQAVADRAAVARWWARAGAMGEEAYMTAGIFPPSEVSLQVVGLRYPQRLGEIYARLLKEQPDTDTMVVAAAISGCAQLSREERVRLLREGMASPTPERVYEALGVLLEFDPAAGQAALIDRLEHWPTDARTSYANQPPETGISEVILNIDSAEVWRAYERALFRATPALRMAMLERLAGIHADPPQDVRQMALLDLFLDDPEVRVIRKEDEAAGGKFEGYAVTPENRRQSVGNLVVELLGKTLKVRPPPGSARTERWWARYREAVRAAVDEHERDALQTPVEEP